MTATLPTVPLLIQGEFVESTTSQWRDVVNPATQEVLARVMEVDVDDVSIKATTTEKLGFTGREEGISAYATVLIEKD